VRNTRSTNAEPGFEVRQRKLTRARRLGVVGFEELLDFEAGLGGECVVGHPDFAYAGAEHMFAGFVDGRGGDDELDGGLAGAGDETSSPLSTAAMSLGRWVLGYWTFTSMEV